MLWAGLASVLSECPCHGDGLSACGCGISWAQSGMGQSREASSMVVGNCRAGLGEPRLRKCEAQCRWRA